MTELEAWVESGLADLEFLKQQFTYLIERDVVTADKIAEAATFINDLRSCESEDEIMISCEDKLNEIKDWLCDRSAHPNQWVAPQESEQVNYVYTDSLRDLRAALTKIDPVARARFFERLSQIRQNFKLTDHDYKKFEPANNSVSKTKDECDSILSEIGVSGIVWEMKCKGLNTEVRFIAVQDNTNMRWFIFSDNYLHRGNAANAHHEYMKRAAKSYVINFNSLENIPEDFSSLTEEFDNLDEVVEELERLFM